MDYNETNLIIQRRLKKAALNMRVLTAKQLVDELKDIIKVVEKTTKKEKE